MLFISLISFLCGGTIGAAIVYILFKIKLYQKKIDIASLQEKIAFFETSQKNVQEQFKGLSADLVAQHNTTFLQLANQMLETFYEKTKGELEKKGSSISELIKPVKETLEKFDGKMGEMEKSRIGAYAALNEQVQNLISTQKDLRKETSTLAKALKAPTVRGRWGEMQLKRVVEMAGMVDHCDFFEQTTASNDEGKGFRPDLIVKLPGGKNIVVDAKAPLDSYLAAYDLQEGDEEKRIYKLKEHALHIRAHMSNLSKKAYWEQFQPTPEFVVLFLPGETFFSAALEQDPGLIEMGVDQKVILATPTTLIALLRAVSYGWRQEKLSQDAQLISQMGKELYKRITDMSSHWVKMGKGLSQSIEAYNKAIGSLETRVLVSARKFVDLQGERELEMLEPILQTPRILQAPEMSDPKMSENIDQLLT